MNVWRIFFEGLKIYCANAHKFLGYMAFPVLGQILGLFMIFGLTGIYTEKLESAEVLPPPQTIVLMIALMVLPGVLLWAKAFWNYLVAYGAINSMTEGALTTGRVYDFKAHNQTVTKRFFPFVLLWMLFGIFLVFAYIPFFWVIGLILFVYFALIFQVFSFEQASPFDCFIKSFQLIKGHFWVSAGLLLILFLFTYFLLPSGVSVVFAAVSVAAKMTAALLPWAEALPLDWVYLLLQKAGIVISPEHIARVCNEGIIGMLVVGFTLPLRSICCVLWYKGLNEQGGKNASKKK